MQSMTGFGSASGKRGGFDVSVEIRSVNHRFFSLKQSLPEGLARYESDLEKLLRAKIGRGSLTLSVSLKSLRPAGPALPDPKTVKEFVRRLRAIQTEAGVKGEIGIDALLALPHLWNSLDAEANKEGAWPAVKDLVSKSVDDLLQMREREGEGIRKDIESRLTTLERLGAQVQERAPMVLEAYQRKLEERITTLLSQRGMETAKADVLKEVAVYADKSDVSEELQRLGSHVGQFRKILRNGGPIGRRLDFLTQEMAREANTLTSKGGDSKISIHAVEMKAELEKIKEQVENIE